MIAIAAMMWTLAAGVAGCTVAGDALPVWRPPPDVPHGVHEFTGSARFVAPDAPTVTVELWGGGGGGGAGSPDTFSEGGAGGGGGAGGAYTRQSLSLVPGRTYVVVVGAGGHAGAAQSGREPAAGGAGGESAICDGGAALSNAKGGVGGGPAMTNSRGGTGGRGASAADDRPSNALALRRHGSDGANGGPPLFEQRGNGGRGGRPPAGSVETMAGTGGAGGAGAMRPEPARNGATGAAGAVIVTW